MALGTFIAGRYTGTYTPPAGSPLALGILEEGYEIEIMHSRELIQRTDAHGDAVIDGIWRGMNVVIQGMFTEWLASVLRALLPYNALGASGGSFLGPGVIGRLDSDLAGILVLSVVTGTPAQVAGAPLTLTATLAIIAPNFQVRWMMGSHHRKLPFRWQILPYNDSGTIKYFSVT